MRNVFVAANWIVPCCGGGCLIEDGGIRIVDGVMV